MSIALVLFIVGLVLAIVEEVQAQGRSLVGWAVIVIAVGLIYAQLA